MLKLCCLVIQDTLSLSFYRQYTNAAANSRGEEEEINW